jgi:Subtilase family
MAQGNRAQAHHVLATAFQKLSAVVPIPLFVAAALPVRILTGGLQKMRDILGLLIFIGIGVLIAAAVVWYVSVVGQWLKAGSGPPSLGTVTILGLEDAKSKPVTAGLPPMILAELKRVAGRTNEAKQQLRDLEATQTQETIAQDPRFAPVPVPESLKTEVAIPQQIAGVEIGWLLTWIKDLLTTTNVIDITVSFDESSKTASLFGHAKGPRGYAFHFENVAGRPDEIARAAAASIVQHEQRRGEIAVQPLAPSDYLPFVSALSAYATFEKVARSWKEQQGRPDFKEQYKQQLDSIARIAEANPQWAELQWLAAEIAERSDDHERALKYTINEQRLTPRNDARYAKLAARLDRLLQTRIAANASEPDLKRARIAAGRPRSAEQVAVVKELMSLPPSAPAHASVRIASIGTPWSEGDPSVRIVRPSSNQEAWLTDYTTGVLQTSRVVAPDAIYEFVGTNTAGGGLRIDDIHDALSEMAKTKPDVVLHAFTSSPSTLATLKALAENSVVVVAAGNSAATSDYASIDEVALVVGATDLKGSRAQFSSSSPNGVWAPGSDIPTVSPTTGQTTQLSGTAYSAAFVAGAAGLLKAAHPTATVRQIVRALRESNKGSGASPVVNIASALELLRKEFEPKG